MRPRRLVRPPTKLGISCSSQSMMASQWTRGVSQFFRRSWNALRVHCDAIMGWEDQEIADNIAFNQAFEAFIEQNAVEEIPVPAPVQTVVEETDGPVPVTPGRAIKDRQGSHFSTTHRDSRKGAREEIGGEGEVRW